MTLRHALPTCLALVTVAACSKQDTSTNAPEETTPAAQSAEVAAEPAAETPTPAATADIVDTAIAAGNFTTLAKALEAADLVETLKGDGPYTVFAPTDEAFAKLPAGTLDNLLANPEQLKAVLLYHVVEGKVMSSDVVSLKEAKAVSGAMLPIEATSGVKVAGANVTQADVEATNGVIHVVDTVMLPPN